MITGMYLLSLSAKSLASVSQSTFSVTAMPKNLLMTLSSCRLGEMKCNTSFHCWPTSNILAAFCISVGSYQTANKERKNFFWKSFLYTLLCILFDMRCQKVTPQLNWKPHSSFFVIFSSFRFHRDFLLCLSQLFFFFSYFKFCFLKSRLSIKIRVIIL